MSYLGTPAPAVLLLSLALLLSACGRSEPDRLVKPRVLFLGVDGADWTVMGPMLENGELPAFRRLVEEGAYMREFGTMDTTFSPLIWTTVATGRAPEDHGVTSFVTELPNGQKIPVSSTSRKARAIWELANRRGLSAGVAGWWATWPAEPVDGYMITDHANPAFASFLFADKTYWTADRQTLASLQRDFHPADIAPVLARHWIRPGSFPYDDLQRRARFTERQMEALRAAPGERRETYSMLKTFYSIDQPLFAATRDLLRERPTDLVMLYLRGPDAIQHYGWDLVEPEKYAVRPPSLERDRGLVQGVYRYVDSFLGELLENAGPETWVIVASDHGGEPAPRAVGNPRVGRPGEHSTEARGVLFVRGPHVKRGYEIQDADPYDLMPTFCWLLGLPLSNELPGAPLFDAFEPIYARSAPLLRVPTYGPREAGPALASASDEKMLESLRSLGYIQ